MVSLYQTSCFSFLAICDRYMSVGQTKKTDALLMKGDKSGKKSKRGIYETVTTKRRPGESRRSKGDSSHASRQEALGIYQEERPAGQEEPAADQRRRQIEAGVRRQGVGEHVRDDEAGEQAPEIAHGHRRRRVFDGATGHLAVALSFSL